MKTLAVVAYASTIAADTTTAGDWTGLLQYGVLGVVAVLFVTGKIIPAGQLDKREEEIARLQAELDDRAKVAEERMIPALVEATRVLAAYLDKESRTSRGRS